MGRPALLRVIVAATTMFALLGASCGSESESSATEASSETASGSEVAAISGVDLGQLTKEERRLFRRIATTALSPCGEPVSLAVCVAEERGCKACSPALGYVRRLVLEGYGAPAIEERMEARYRTDPEDIPVGDAAVRGSAMAPITLVEFSDFECPSCGAAHPLVESALERFPEQLRFVMMNYPLPGHAHAGEAARASIAAGRQGRFWEMHDWLFEHQRSLGRAEILRFAAELGLDEGQFVADLESDVVREQVDGQKRLGRRLGVEGTPTFFVNGRKYLDSPRMLSDYLQEEIDALR